jgi:hypothetical protein
VKQARKDDTQFLRIVTPTTDSEKVRAIAHAVREALQVRANLVNSLAGGVGYEAQLVSERLDKDGVSADLQAIRIGEYFKRITEFNILQRLDRFVRSVVDERPDDDLLKSEEDDG